MNTSPVRVLRLVTRLNIGGPARQALLLSRDLGDRYSTTLAAGTPEPGEGELSDPDVEVVRLPLVRAVNPRLDVWAFAKVRALMARQRPSIVHTHMAKAGALGRSAAWTVRPRPATVHTFHGHVLDGYFSEMASRGFREAERLLARGTDMILSVSPEVRDQLLGFGIGKPETFRVVPLGLDLSAFAGAVPAGDSYGGPASAGASPGSTAGAFRSAIGVPSGVPLVGMVGRLVPIKDHVTAFEAIARLDGVHLAVVGDGELRSSLEEKAARMGLASRVHFSGWQAEVAPAFSDMDAVVLTSRNEGTPVSLIEAAAAARAVVATDVGGVRHVVDDGRTGLVVPAGDAPAVAAALAKLLGDPSLRVAMGEAARPMALARFGKERLLADIEALYGELLERRGSKR